MPNTVNSYIETDLGNVSPNPRGEYNAKYDYEYLDLIYYKGGSYLCLAPLGETIKNVPPIVGQTTTNWQCVAIPGDLTPEYISMYNEVVKDYNETNTNTADVAQMKDITYASMTAAQESESKASTSETNARNSEVNAKQSMDKAKEYSDEAIRVNNDTQSLVTGFDEHVATAISNAEASISESTDNAKGEIVAQKSSSLNEFRTDAETVMTNEKNVAVAEIHQMVDNFSADADSKKQEVIQVADEKINAMTALKNDAVNAKNAAETAATTAVEKASETATYAGEAKSSSDSAKANADLVSANKIEIDNAKSDVESKVEQFESDLETYSVRTLRSDMTELQKETSDGFAELKSDKIDKPKSADNNKFPRAKDGDVEWVEQGLPTDEQTANAVQNWLNEHPEATTTVQDESITESKFALSLREKKANYYKNVSEMQSDILLRKGMVAVTLGYYETDDGGGATYIIDDKETNASRINIQLNNGLYANICIKSKTINVLTAGIKNDGKTPINDKLNGLLGNIRYNRLFFPSGIYILNKRINCIYGFDVTFIGDSNASENYYVDGSRNNTIFTVTEDYSDDCLVYVGKGARVTIKNILFNGNSYSITCDDNISTTGNIHNMYSENIIKPNLSGVIIESAQSLVRDCVFNGFSDNGLNVRQYNNIENCRFVNCRIGLQASFDNIINNIMAQMCTIGVLLGADKSTEATSLNESVGGSNIVSNLRIDGMSKHGIEIYGFMNILSEYLSDQTNFASIVIAGSNTIISNALLSRSAQYSAGNEMPTDSNEQEKYCALFVKGTIGYCDIDCSLRYTPGNDLNKKNSITPFYALCSNDYLNNNVFNYTIDWGGGTIKNQLKDLINVKKSVNSIFKVNGNTYELMSYINNDNYIENNIAKSRNAILRTGVLYENENSIFMYNKKANSWIEIK